MSSETATTVEGPGNTGEAPIRLGFTVSCGACGREVDVVKRQVRFHLERHESRMRPGSVCIGSHGVIDLRHVELLLESARHFHRGLTDRVEDSMAEIAHLQQRVREAEEDAAKTLGLIEKINNAIAMHGKDLEGP